MNLPGLGEADTVCGNLGIHQGRLYFVCADSGRGLADLVSAGCVGGRRHRHYRALIVLAALADTAFHIIARSTGRRALGQG